MVEIRWSPQAADEVEANTDFIAADSVHYFKIFAVDVLSVVDRLTELPYYPLMNLVPVSNQTVIIYQGDCRFMVL